MRFKVQKTHYFPLTVQYCCSSMLHLSETHTFFTKLIILRSKACSDWPAIQCVGIGRYLKHETEILPYCDAVSWHDDIKTIKPIINEAFVASSGDIITDYNDLYCLFTRHVASHRVNITMSAFVIGEMTNNKHYSTLLKTHVWIVSGKFFK